MRRKLLVGPISAVLGLPLIMGAASGSDNLVSSTYCSSLQPTKVETGKLGERIYHFAVPGALDTIQIVPPPGFDPTSATPSQLKELRLRPAPADPAARAAWASSVKVPQAPPGICQPDASLPRAGVNNAYSGVAATPQSGHPYQGISADNRVFVTQPGCGGSLGETSWVGIRSDTASPSPALVQNGTYRLSSTQSDAPRIFYENISEQVANGPQFPGGLAVHPWDLVNYETLYWPASVTNSGDPEAWYTWIDHTTNQSLTIYSILSPSQTWYNPSTAEADFIDEKFGSRNLQAQISIGWASAFVDGAGNGGSGNQPGNLPRVLDSISNAMPDEDTGPGMLSVSNWNDFYRYCN